MSFGVEDKDRDEKIQIIILILGSMECFKFHPESSSFAMKLVWNSSVVGFNYRHHWLSAASPERSRGMDPLASKYPHASPYNYCEGNPINKIDPDGRSAGDIYNLDGVHIGNDGIDDKKVYLKTTTSSQQLTLEESKAATANTGIHGMPREPVIDITAQTGLNNDELNMNAMLGTIRESEGHGTPVGYNTLYGGGTFDSYDSHPNVSVTKWGHTSTAAGAYQFLFKTWKKHAEALGLSDFSPASQDKVAVKEIGLVKGATSMIYSGNYTGAISKLSGKWTSLPGGVHAWKGFSNDIFLKHRANELLGKSIIGK